MSDRHYLLKVLSLSALPRIVTFGLKFVSTAMMIRALGPKEYGNVIFISAIVSIFESIADFGISSAAGKNISAAREASDQKLSDEIEKWVFLQTIVSIIGFFPMLGFTYVIAYSISTSEFDLVLMGMIVAAAWITIAINFVRSALTALLEFKSLAILDSTESLLRSCGFLFAAYFIPNGLGLTALSLIISILTSLIGIKLLSISRYVAKSIKMQSLIQPIGVFLSIYKSAIRESLAFLWLRMATRVYQSFPLIILGKYFGTDLVGIVGAFSRITEMINFPYGVFGNALAVRSSGIQIKGQKACKNLWDFIARMIATSVPLALTILICSDTVADFLSKGQSQSAAIVEILSLTIITTAISSIVNPISDYVGGLKLRNQWLSAVAVLQMPILWIGCGILGDIGSIYLYVGLIAIMNFGYVIISLKLFFPTKSYSVCFEVVYFVASSIIGFALIEIWELYFPTGPQEGMEPYVPDTMAALSFWLFVVICVLISKRTRSVFATRRLFYFS